jgi:hypothetical protein
MKKGILLTGFLSIIFFRIWTGGPGISEANPGNGLLDELSGGFHFDLRCLTYGTYQDVADSTQNPGNDFLQTPRYLADLDIRPDAELNFRRLELGIKPRINLQWKKWGEGTRKGDDDLDDDWYINEWLARLRVTDTLFVSYGRENLQWGPSYVFSPSNPFFLDNGRSNPKKEVPSLDFARLVWIPKMEWTFSFIINDGEGRQIFQPTAFERSYALKIDYNGSTSYGSLILSHREKDRDRVGAFGGWTVTDALLVYGETGFSEGSNALYPDEDRTSPFGASMSYKDDADSSWKGNAVIGGSYTFMAGPTLTVEYFYNGQGYNDEQADLYYDLRKRADEAYTGLLNGLSRMTLGRTVNNGLKFLRRHYAVVQYRQSDIRDVLNLSLSWIQNLDDDSTRILANADYYIGDHIQLFTIGSLDHGGADREFGTILDSFLMIGLEYTF